MFKAAKMFTANKLLAPYTLTEVNVTRQDLVMIYTPDTAAITALKRDPYEERRDVRHRPSDLINVKILNVSKNLIEYEDWRQGIKVREEDCGYGVIKNVRCAVTDSVHVEYIPYQEGLAFRSGHRQFINYR